MQELISFIAIMIGVAVLTAWAMWLMLRTSGESKALKFARESAREGLTSAVMENNHLKNKIEQLERQLKVCLDAGYGNIPSREDSEVADLKKEEWDEFEARIKAREEELKAEEEEILAKEEKLKNEEHELQMEEAELKIEERMLKISEEDLEAENEWIKVKEEGFKA